MPLNTNQQWYPNIGIGIVNHGNSKLDGSGSIVDILVPGHDGTLVNSITIKAQAVVSQGMIRFFIQPKIGTPYTIFREVIVPPYSQSDVLPSFTVILKGGFYLPAGSTLAASTQNSEPFVITVDALDFENCPCS